LPSSHKKPSNTTLLAHQVEISGKTYEVLTTFYAKQTQLLKSQMNVNLYNTTDYENISNWTLGENKPNSNLIKPNLKKNECKLLCYRVL